MSRKKRKSFLERAEDNILEHVPDKYQKAVTGVYRFGFFINIVSVLCAIFALLSIVSYFSLEQGSSPSILIMRIILFVIFIFNAILGARYTKMKMTPPLAFGWAIILGLTSLVLTGFFGFIFFTALVTNLSVVYGAFTMLIIEIIMAGLTILPLIIFLNAVYYLFFAHKKYTKWYKNYSKRHHLNDDIKAKTKKIAEYSDEDL